MSYGPSRIVYHLTRKRVKNIHLRVTGGCRARVGAFGCRHKNESADSSAEKGSPCKRSVSYGPSRIVYHLTRKRVKNIHLRVTGGGCARVGAFGCPPQK